MNVISMNESHSATQGNNQICQLQNYAKFISRVNNICNTSTQTAACFICHFKDILQTQTKKDMEKTLQGHILHIFSPSNHH